LSFKVGNILETQESLYLNIKDVVASRTYIASETRFGKSHLARLITEECFGHIGIIIIDPEGEYASLREKYPFLIIGRDVPIEVETETLKAATAEFMAQQVLETKVSVIIDLSLVEDVESAKEYVDTFLRRFFHLQTTAKQPYLVIWEEAEDFAPEAGAPGTRTCLEIATTYARRGGKRGIGIIFIGHRPAWISKGILSQCPNKAVGRIESTDMKALEEYARIPASIVEKLVPKTDDEGEIVYSGPSRGEFCFTGDWVEKTTFVKVGPVKTTHLGSTPEIVPFAPKEIQSVITSLQNSLQQAIQKIKPAVVSTAEIESKIRSELETKYKDKINAILKTADEKAERKYRVDIEKLKTLNEQLSRSQALQPVSPITDVLEHPIVKTRILELPDKARDLLIRIEHEPGLTREQLAAFLATSKDTVASLVDKINRVFHATAIIGDGKPVRYKSMLRRLYLTDVAKREIEEIERLQADNQAKAERILKLEEESKVLRNTVEQARVQHGEVENLRKEVSLLKENKIKLESDLKTAKNDIECLKKEAEVVQRLRELLSIRGVDEKKIEAFIEQKLSVMIPTNTEIVIDERKIEALIDQKISEKATTAPPSGTIPTSVELEHKVTHFDFKKSEEHIEADTTTLQGRIIYLITKGFFQQRHNRKEVVTELSNNGWIHDDKEVDVALLELCQKGVLYRKISTGNIFWYWLTQEAKELIHT